jgi:hypothetical protein
MTDDQVTDMTTASAAVRSLLSTLKNVAGITVSTEIDRGQLTLIGLRGESRSVPQTAPLAAPMATPVTGCTMTQAQAVEILEETLEVLADSGFYVSGDGNGRATVARLVRNKVSGKVIQPCGDRIVVVSLERKFR